MSRFLRFHDRGVLNMAVRALPATVHLLRAHEQDDEGDHSDLIEVSRNQKRMKYSRSVIDRSSDAMSYVGGKAARQELVLMPAADADGADADDAAVCRAALSLSLSLGEITQRSLQEVMVSAVDLCW